MSHNYFRVLFDKNLGPEVLDEWVREKVSADVIVVFSENMCEEDSIDLDSLTRDRLAHGTWEE